MANFIPRLIPTRLVRLGVVGAALALVTACGSTDESDDASGDGQGAPSAVTDVGTTPVTTSQSAVTTSAPATTEGCGSQCPLTDQQEQAVDAFFEAYNGDDWDAVLATISEPEPSWQMTPSLVSNVDDMRADFVFSTAMDETWSPTGCVDQYGLAVCKVEMEDALVRSLASIGLSPSVCSLSFTVDDDGVWPERYDLLSGCHNLYDGVMHAYGDWFAANYPDEAPIQGFHYRGWNTSDETAGTSAATHVEEFRAAAIGLLGDDGDIANYRSSG